MSTQVSKLRRLARSKTTGNVIITLSLLLGVAILLNGLFYGISSVDDTMIIFGGGILSLIFSFIVNRHMRKPFFKEFSKYLEELKIRSFTIQQLSVQAELIEPLQTLKDYNEVIRQLEDYRLKINEIAKVTSEEASINSVPTRDPNVRKEFQVILRTAALSLEEIDDKRKNMVFLAETRHILLNTVVKYTNRPRNEIETDYLLFKIQKGLKGYPLDESVFNRILTHVLNTGEIEGNLMRTQDGEKVITVNRVQDNLSSNVDNLSWNSSAIESQSNDQCVICRHAIRDSEEKITCDVCHNVFHRNHLLEWLKVFGDCPICHNRMTLFSE
ncbi:MAG: RING finger protein [Candidatus Hodarchaeales archaeon]